MKTLVLLPVLLASAGAFVFTNTQMNELWEKYKAVFNKVYKVQEENLRRSVWLENLNTIMNHNVKADLGASTFSMGMTQFSDLTDEEFIQQVSCIDEDETEEDEEGIVPHQPLGNDTLPDYVNWYEEGYVTPVQNQGECGCCYAFTTAGTLESHYKRVSDKLTKLSEQNILDCSRKYGNRGCRGGFLQASYKYIEENGGIDTAESYPYEGKEEECRFKSEHVAATCKGFARVKRYDECEMQKAVAKIGPLSVSMAVIEDFKQYKTGIYNSTEACTKINHGVVIIGYGTENDCPYWRIKNSWGINWGMKGYGLMVRNENICQVSKLALYPLVD